MDSRPATGASEQEIEAFAALTRRVYELERQMAALQLAWPGIAVSTPPPPVSRPVPSPMQPMPALTQPVVSAPAALAPKRSLEDRIGGQIFNRIAILALLIGVASFLKLAIDHGWIGPAARVVIGLVAGCALVLWSERFRRNGAPTFSYSLKAVGAGVLYLSLWDAYQVHHLLPAPIALMAMILVTAWNAFMAWRQDAELLAAYALAGAFATPLLLSTGENHELFLFTYIFALDLATLLLVRLKPWPRILVAALTGTVSFYFGWYGRFYGLFATPGQDHPPLALTIAFLLAFWAIFEAATVRGILTWREDARPGAAILLSTLEPLLNGAFIATGLGLLLQGAGHHDLLAWLMAALAAVYLGLLRLPRTAISAAVHLALAIVFLTIAVPLKASGHTLTVAWLVEGAALLWASTRTPHAPTRQTAGASRLTPANVLRVLAAGSLTLGFVKLIFDRFWYDSTLSETFFNAELGSAAVATGVFALVAWLLLRPGAEPTSHSAVGGAIAAFFALDATATLLTGRELGFTPYGLPHTPFANPDFLTALTGLAVLALSLWLSLRLPAAEDRPVFRRLAGLTLVLFNLLAIFAVEHEIGTLWTRSDARLERSLAISGFLMLYGGVLLAVGFVRRIEFVRWQALVLIVFTIAKVFLYDVSGLSEGYRVASFLGLGVLLMAVSFAYQKDWLSLRPAAELQPEPPAPGRSA